DDAPDFPEPHRVARVAAVPAREHVTDHGERLPLEHQAALAELRRPETRDHRPCGPPCLGEPQRALLRQRHDGLAEEQPEVTLGRFVDRDQIRGGLTDRGVVAATGHRWRGVCRRTWTMSARPRAATSAPPATMAATAARPAER